MQRSLVGWLVLLVRVVARYDWFALAIGLLVARLYRARRSLDMIGLFACFRLIGWSQRLVDWLAGSLCFHVVE